MNAEEYDRIKDWPLSMQLSEIQGKIESGRILAQAIANGHTNDVRRDAETLRAELLNLADWIGHVKKHHARQQPTS